MKRPRFPNETQLTVMGVVLMILLFVYGELIPLFLTSLTRR